MLHKFDKNNLYSFHMEDLIHDAKEVARTVYTYLPLWLLYHFASNLQKYDQVSLVTSFFEKTSVS